jgi:hypothetical protein
LLFTGSCTLKSAKSRAIEGEQEITFMENEAGKKIEVFAGGKPFTTFQWPDNICKSVLYPIFASSGTEITRGFPVHPKSGERADHPHQIGMWLTYGNVNGNDFWGTTGWFFSATGFPEAESYVYSASTASISSLWFFQAVFCAISLAIVFGSMLDRTKFIGYILFAIPFTGFIYPVVAHWTWGGGWLFKDGFLDYAGSSIVHLQGALGALVGALILGPRIGKFRNGKAIPIPGHSIPLAITGVIILWFGWMGFNGGSSLLATGVDFADVIVNTNIAAAAGILGATIGTAAVATPGPGAAIASSSGSPKFVHGIPAAADHSTR